MFFRTVPIGTSFTACAVRFMAKRLIYQWSFGSEALYILYIYGLST